MSLLIVSTAARERQRLAQAASEQSRRQAALELEDDAAHAEISAVRVAWSCGATAEW
jgi:hypothetical protein